MARPKKMDDEFMLSLAQQYYAEKCSNNIELLKVSKIGEYIRSKGYDVQDHLIRRNELVREYIDSIKADNETAKIKIVSVFNDMDVDDFLKRNRTQQALRTALVERQNYYMQVAHSASLIFKENKKLKEKLEKTEKEISLLEQQLESSDFAKKETLKGFHEAKRKARILQDLVETYVYPEIANELLVQKGILKKTEGMVDPKVVEENLIRPADNVRKIENKLIKGLFDTL